MTSVVLPPPSPQSRELSEWLAWLERLSPREIDLGLERVQQVLSRLALPRPRRVVHVAGTNGKGSTVALLEALYRRDPGRTVACYTSPHVLRYNERMRVNGRDLDDELILDAFEAVEAARGDTLLTYFEFGTLAALAAFARLEADTWILEIGLGGRLDAVNALDPDGAVITNISLDHCDWLGHDLESIAREKAGVMRARIPFVFASAQVPDAILSVAADRGARLLLAQRDYRVSGTAAAWSYTGPGKSLPALRAPSLSGAFQVGNAAGALTLYMALETARGLDDAAINGAFANVRLPGRLQRIDGKRRYLLDVAHNPGAASVLAAALAEERGSGNVVALLGVLADKDIDGILAPLLPHVAAWVAVTAAGPRALPARKLAEKIAATTGKPCRIAADTKDGLRLASALADRRDLVLVSGSFYTVGPVLAELAHCDILATQ